MTAAERDQLALQGLAAREFADWMLSIVLAVEQADFWLARIMGRAA